MIPTDTASVIFVVDIHGVVQAGGSDRDSDLDVDHQPGIALVP
jgi:hypothetical protein